MTLLPTIFQGDGVQVRSWLHKGPCREPVTSRKRCCLRLPGMPSPFLKVALCPVETTVIFFREKKSVFLLKSSVFKTQRQPHVVACLQPLDSVFSDRMESWAAGGPRDRVAALEPYQNSLDPSASSHPDMASCMTCVFAVSAPHCTAHQGGARACLSKLGQGVRRGTHLLLIGQAQLQQALTGDVSPQQRG